MASSIAVVFMTVMIGLPYSTSGTAPTITKETTVITGSNAMPVCRRLESNFHMSNITTSGETKISIEETNIVRVRRESSCVQITL